VCLIFVSQGWGSVHSILILGLCISASVGSIAVWHTERTHTAAEPTAAPPPVPVVAGKVRVSEVPTVLTGIGSVVAYNVVQVLKFATDTPDEITGSVFTVHGSHVDVVRNRGAVVTYGVGDMVLDNWGVVDRWTADQVITSHGPSGICFVNFGIVHELKVNAPIETFDQGARGFNVCTGTMNLAEFDPVTTHADGAVDIQIGQPIGRLIVHRGIETFGGTGPSLVKGAMIKLSAIALSLAFRNSGSEAESLEDSI
jgi:hypothetical protein